MAEQGNRASEASSDPLREQREVSEASSDPLREQRSERLRIVRGVPTPEEVAALVAVISALGGAGTEGAPASRSAWSDPAWRLVGPQARRGGWRVSSLPR